MSRISRLINNINIILAEPWTPKKQIQSVGLLFLTLMPFVLLYLLQSQIITLIVTVIRFTAGIFGIPMEE